MLEFVVQGPCLLQIQQENCLRLEVISRRLEDLGGGLARVNEQLRLVETLAPRSPLRLLCRARGPRPAAPRTRPAGWLAPGRLSGLRQFPLQLDLSGLLPPKNPPLTLDAGLANLLSVATAALGRLAVAGQMVPSAEWFLYGFVRKEAVISSQIEGTQATLQDVLTFEATQKSDHPADVEEVCNYVDALTYARREMARPKGLPLSTRLLCETHKRLMHGQRGSDKLPGEIRRSQNWIGGTRPGNARFVPPPPEQVPEAMSALEHYLHDDNGLPPLVRAGLAHVQFETIRPFLDGNGRIGRLLITLLVEHWGLLPSPLLYLSLAFNRRREEYYRRLSAVRSDGDWEGWTAYFLECVQVAADDGVTTAQRTFALLNKDRQSLLKQKGATIPAIRLFDLLPNHPIVTLPRVIDLLETTKPTAAKAIEALCRAKVLRETTGKARDRVYAYHGYLQLLTKDTKQ